MESSNQKVEASRLIEIVRVHARLAGDGTAIELESNLFELGLDSAGALNLLLDLEDAYGVIFPEALFTEETFRSPAALRTALLELGAE